MQFFLNPFKKHDHLVVADVLVPIEQNRDGNKSEGDVAIENLKAEVESDLQAGGVDTAYDRKSKVINRAIQDIGMGRYQWELFVLCGFGWLADNLWLQGVALTLTPLASEFGISNTEVRYTTLSLFTGLCIGASFWGTASDLIGRRLAFNCTLFLAGLFGLASGGGPNWIGTCSLYACIGLGVGGNLPVDGALFLEFLPFASGNLLTLLSVFWPVGQLISSLVAWGFIPNYSCPESGDGSVSCKLTGGQEPCCSRDQNMGWRYLVLTLGAFTFVMFILRFFFFHLYESPKFLLSRGRQAEAVAVVHGIAHKNHAKTWLTVEILEKVGGVSEVVENEKLGTVEIIRRNLGKFSTDRIGPLFRGKRLSITTVLIWLMWTTIGMGYPLFNAFLPQYLVNSGSGQPTSTNIVYRNYAITSIVGVPGSIFACYTVEIKYIGRKGTMAIATAISGMFLFLFTTSTDSNIQLVFSSLEALFQNIMYGVLYAYTPEVFPAPNRGTGTGISSFLNRVAGLCAPIVAVHAGQANPLAPIYASGGLFLAAFVAMCFLPIETRGKQSL
ncbi:MFS general substrate transporter [Xylariaceae sp. FL0662B]|nr:MFS general substrate transporter [Xylariaceae sp. FL0662B]